MFTKRIKNLLKIRPDELRLVLLVAGVFATIELGRSIGGSAADAMFFLRFGVENLPYMYILLGVVNFVAALLYAAYLTRAEKGRLFTRLLLGFVAVLLVERVALSVDIRAFYPVLWLSINIIGLLLGTMVWNIAGEVCDARQAKRLFPLFVSAAILGGLAGSLIIGPTAAALGTENLLIIYAALLLVAFLLIRSTAPRYFHPVAKDAGGSTFLADIRTGLDVVRRSPLLQRLAISAVLFSVLYFSISFPFGKAVSAAFTSEAEVAGFLGAFSGITGALTFVAALLIANRLYTRIGVVNSLLILPFTYLAGFALFAVNFSLVTAAIVRLSQMVVLSGIGDAAYGAFFNVVPPNKRAQVRAFDSGIPSQIGIMLSGILLILGERSMSTTQIFAMGMGVALLCAFVIWQMRKSYANALIAALSAGRVDVFTEDGAKFVPLQGQADALRILTDALRDPKPSLRRLAAEMLMRVGTEAAGPALLQALSDPDPAVRGAVIRALGELKVSGAAPPLLEMLNDPDPSVRLTALEVLSEIWGPDSARPEGVSPRIECLLNDEDLRIRARAAVMLANWGAVAVVLPALQPILQAGEPRHRALGLSCMGEILAWGRNAAGDILPVLNALADPSPLVRRTACLALGQIRQEAAIQPLVDRLDDPDEGVRFGAAEALKLFGSKATSAILQVLQTETGAAHEAALAALTVRDASALPTLRAFARQEMARLREWRQISYALPAAGRATAFLREILARHALRNEQRLVKIIGLFRHQTALMSIAQALREHDTEVRAAAVEALDTLGDRELTTEVLPLLETTAGQPVFGASNDAPPTLDAIFATLLSHDDHWLRGLGARAAGEMRLKAVVPTLTETAKDSDPFVRDAARDALHELGERGEPGALGEPMETLQTVSLVERIMLLREVPLFASLSPEDLKQVAEIAHEHWYNRGDIICREGEAGHELYVIVTGNVSIIKASNGTSKFLGIRRAGEFIGEMAILDSMARMATVRAEEDTRTLVIEGELFKAILKDRPDVSFTVARELSRRLRERD